MKNRNKQKKIFRKSRRLSNLWSLSVCCVTPAFSPLNQILISNCEIVSIATGFYFSIQWIHYLLCANFDVDVNVDGNGADSNSIRARSNGFAVFTRLEFHNVSERSYHVALRANSIFESIQSTFWKHQFISNAYILILSSSSIAFFLPDFWNINKMTATNICIRKYDLMIGFHTLRLFSTKWNSNSSSSVFR